MQFVFGFLLIALSVTASADQTDQADQDMLKGLAYSMAVLIESNLSCGSISDCKMIPLAVNACGGTASYAAVSKLNPYIPAVQYLNNEYTTLQQKIFTKNGVSVICFIVPEPSLECVSNKCQILEE